MLVDEVMTTHPVTVRPDTEVADALRLLDRHAVTTLPVVDGSGRLRGVVSEADLIRDRVSADPRQQLRPTSLATDQAERVGDVMSAFVISVTPRTDVATVIGTVTATGVKSLPVVDADQRVVGMISRRDIVHAIARSDEDLEVQIDEMLRRAGVVDWLVDAKGGVVHLTGPGSASDAATVRVLARAVPGVIDVHVTRH